jgi:hypothetical protein
VSDPFLCDLRECGIGFRRYFQVELACICLIFLVIIALVLRIVAIIFVVRRVLVIFGLRLRMVGIRIVVLIEQGCDSLFFLVGRESVGGYFVRFL